MAHEQRGATLTEFLVVAALIGIALVVLVPALWVAGQSWGRVDRHEEMLQNARRATDRLIRHARTAQWFQLISPTLVRFVAAVGDGTGATPTLEYRLNAASSDREYRISADFAFRRRITVSAGPAAVPAGYSVAVTFNHAALVTAGKSLPGGDDVRVRYWAGAGWVELDRFKDVPTAWNTTATQVWFRLQSPIPAGGSDGNYYLHYGDLAAGPAPANGDYVFLDHEDGTSLAEWIRRDACSGTYATSVDGFVFQSASAACYRQVTKNVPHGNVEIFWGFRSTSPGAGSNRHQVGMSARRSGAGAGYLVTPGDANNQRLRIQFVTSWAAAGSIIAQTPVGVSVSPGVDHYGRFYLVGSSLRAKHWVVGTAEPGWLLTATHSGAASGAHYGQVDGFASPQDHRHRHLIVRQRLDPEPTSTLGPEESGSRPDPFEPLAGPFRSMSLQCFDSSGGPIGCAPAAAVRSIQVSLTAMDPSGEVGDLVVTSRAYRQAP